MAYLFLVRWPLSAVGVFTVTFDYQPVLKGDLVEVRPLLADNFADLYAVAADPLIWEQHPVRTRYEAAVFREFFQEALACGGTLIVKDLKTHRVIGSSRFHAFNEKQSEVEIGWTFLARSHWGGAYNRDMKRVMLQHAFRFVGSVVFLIGVENVRSQRAVEKIGAVRMGRGLDASGRDSYLYKINAATFGQPEKRHLTNR